MYIKPTIALITMVVVGFSSHLQAAKDSNATKLLDGFAAHLKKQEGISDDLRDKGLEQLEKLRQEELSSDDAVTIVLAEVYPQLSDALRHLAVDDTKTAGEKLAALTKDKDGYLAAVSRFFLARSKCLDEDFEAARPQLEALLKEPAERSLHRGETLFLKGLADSRTLRRKEAVAALQEFIKDYPTAPERLQVAAARELSRIEQRLANSLADIQDRMEFSRRRISRSSTDKDTRKQQDEIIARLEKLIKEAEEQEQSQSSSSEQKQQQQQQPGQSQGGPGQQGPSPGADADGNDNPVRRRVEGDRSPWGSLRNKQREEEALAAIKARFPARYQELVKQYFQALQDKPEE